MNDVKEGDTVRAIGNHCWKGREGIVEQVEDVEGTLYVHVTMDNGETIIMRPGQYKVVKRGNEEPIPAADRLSPLFIKQIRFIGNNHRYGIDIRKRVLENGKAEIETLLLMLDHEKECLDL